MYGDSVLKLENIFGQLPCFGNEGLSQALGQSLLTQDWVGRIGRAQGPNWHTQPCVLSLSFSLAGVIF